MFRGRPGDRRLDVGLVDAEGGVIVGLVGLGHRVEHPLDGAELVIADHDRLAVADEQQAGAGDGFERFDPALVEHGQFAEGGEVEGRSVGLRERG